MTIKTYLKSKKQLIDLHLEKMLPSAKSYPLIIHQAMRYSLFPGGKRIRPILLLAAAEATGKVTQEALFAACAVEIVHAYSLVHDDMPCMDNADMRRGKLSVHKKYGETIGLLCGDALLTLGFRVLARALSGVPNQRKCRTIIEEFADAIGSQGMIGGQVAEYMLQEKEKTLPDIQYIHTHKTGALIAHAIRLGAFFAGGSKRQIDTLFRFGEFVGFCFQIMDDIVDNDGYVLVVGPKRAHEEATRMFSFAKKEIAFLGKKAHRLIEIGESIVSL